MTPAREELQAQLDNVNKQLESTTDKKIIQNCERTRAIIISQMMDLK